MDLVRTRRAAEAGLKLRDKNRVGTERLDLIRESLVESLNDGHHEDHGNDAHTDAQDRQRRAQLVSAQRVERHQGRFFDVVESHLFIADCRLPIFYCHRLQFKSAIGNRHYSALNASMGSNFAARHAGHKPLTIPTTEETPTANTAEATLTSSGNPMSAEIT